MAHLKIAKPNQTGQGIAIILGSVLMMAFADAMVKLVSSDMTIWQVFVTRSLVAAPLLIAVICATGFTLKVRVSKWALIRSTFLVLTWLAYYTSLPVLDLSVAAVAVYTNPIIIALLSAIVIKEAVSARQWIGVFLGFLGVIAILKPGTDAFSWFTLLPILGAFFYAVAMIITRDKCQTETPLMLALILNVLFLVTGLIGTGMLAGISFDTGIKTALPFLLGDWAPMSARQWGLMALLGLLLAAYSAGVARAYQIAPPSIIATFDYAYLISAALWGFVFFFEKPDLLTISGMALITLAGVCVAVPSSKKR